jgi:Peptidase family M23
MRSHRTIARGVTLVLLLGLPAGVAAAYPQSHPPDPRHSKPKPKGKPIIFPVVGQVQYTNDFGEPRPQGPHQGNDVMAPRKALAVAAEAGTIKFWTHSAGAGCMLYLYGRSGTTYYYIHLNNDVTMHNDNRGKCGAGMSYAPGLKDGTKVAAGQLIGFVGDSGDADGVHPHLHFEVHPHNGKAVSPYPFLNRGRRLLFSILPGKNFNVSLSGSVVSTTGSSLTMKVASLKVWPGRLRVPDVERTVTVEVPPAATILRRSLGRGSAAHVTTLDTAQKGVGVTLRTVEAPRTLGALLGRPLALDAESVLLAAT